MIQCRLAFECPKKWADLSPTRDKNIKFCDECNSEVYWVSNPLEISAYIKESKCIAFESNKTLMLGQPDGVLTECYVLVKSQHLSAKQLFILKSELYPQLSYIELKNLFELKEVKIETGSLSRSNEVSALLTSFSISSLLISQ